MSPVSGLISRQSWFTTLRDGVDFTPMKALTTSFFCKRAGIHVHYCAELFRRRNRHKPALLKAIKRIMAGEFRELSVKTFAGQCRLARSGLQDGRYCRLRVTTITDFRDGTPRQILEAERNLASDRVLYVLGPP